MMRMIRSAMVVLAVALCVAGCDKTRTAGNQNPPPMGEAPLPPAGMHPPVVPARFEGVVAEVANASRYTYARLANDSGELWVALPQTELKVGEAIAVESGILMTNFHSEALGRTFEAIYFSAGRLREGVGADGTGDALPPGHPAVQGGAPAEAHAARPAGPTLTGQVVEALDAGRYTYVQVMSGTNQIWAAGPKFAVKKGDTVTVPLEMSMPNFNSPTLKRSFDLLYMASKIIVTEKAGDK